MRIAIAAGESSGDALGAGLIAAIREQAELAEAPEFVGVAGPGMRAAGCADWNQTEELSVMGLAEVLRHLPRLLKLRRRLLERLLDDPPDVFVGIDSPDFNLPLAKKLKAAGIPTVQYVSPQVWAWRQSRVKSIAGSVDTVLCLLPFEASFYADNNVPAQFVGHPLADEIPLSVEKHPVRELLGLAAEGPVLALLPGSRRSEISRLARPFAETAAWLSERIPGLVVQVAIAHQGLVAEWEAATADLPAAAAIGRQLGRAREVMAAADIVLTASGTASLETMLVKRPFVVAYKMAASSYFILRRMGIQKLPFYSLPNLLAGEELAPEFVQGDVRAEVLGPALLAVLNERVDTERRLASMAAVHEQLSQGGSSVAAAAVLELARQGGAAG